MGHLWTGGAAPAEYVELQLCREFHVLPSQLRREPIRNVQAILTMMDVEAKVANMKKKSRNGR